MPRWVIMPKFDIKSVSMLTPDEEQLKEFFKSFDADHDGRLDKQDLTNAFKSLGSRCPAWRVMRVFHHADSNGDGYISTDELDDLVKYAFRKGYRVPTVMSPLVESFGETLR